MPVGTTAGELVGGPGVGSGEGAVVGVSGDGLCVVPGSVGAVTEAAAGRDRTDELAQEASSTAAQMIAQAVVCAVFVRPPINRSDAPGSHFLHSRARHPPQGRFHRRSMGPARQ